MQITKNETLRDQSWSKFRMTPSTGTFLMAKKVQVEPVLLLPKDKGRRERKGVIGGSRSEGKVGVWR